MFRSSGTWFFFFTWFNPVVWFRGPAECVSICWAGLGSLSPLATAKTRRVMIGRLGNHMSLFRRGRDREERMRWLDGWGLERREDADVNPTSAADCW
jgi:hypothetical protein